MIVDLKLCNRTQKLYYTLDNIQLSLQEGIEKSEELITKHPNSKFEKLSNIMIKSVLQDITGKHYITKEEYLLVGDYLSAIDYWSEFELKLLYYTCLILDEGDICWFWQLVTDRACHFNKGNNQKLFLATLLNIYELTVLDRQNISNANVFRVSLQNFIVNKEPTILIVFTIVTYFHDYLLEKTSENRKKIENYLNATETIGVKYMADYYRSRLVDLDEK